MTEKALGLQKGLGMKRITVGLLAAALMAMATGCGLAPDETIDQDGNVVKVGSGSSALVASDDVSGAPVGVPGAANPDPKTLVNPLPPTSFTPNGSPTVTSPYDPTIALPQDPIPLLDPAKVDPRTGRGPVVR